VKPANFFCTVFVYFGWQVGLFASLTPSTTNPFPGTPSANSQRTKQFLSCPCGLYLFLSEGAELLTSTLPLSYLSPRESYMTPSRTAAHFFTAIQIKVKFPTGNFH
jgi:hypothetical protein